MSEAVFLDTAGLIALLNRDDSLHSIATQVLAQLEHERSPMVTTNLVLAELGNGLARTPLRHDVGWLIRGLYAEPRATVVDVDRALFDRGLTVYLSRNDKSWGLIDCISFEAMRNLRIHQAFTADRHFQQAGFDPLLRRMMG